MHVLPKNAYCQGLRFLTQGREHVQQILRGSPPMWPGPLSHITPLPADLPWRPDLNDMQSRDFRAFGDPVWGNKKRVLPKALCPPAGLESAKHLRM